MIQTNELMDQYRRFLLTESESISSTVTHYGKRMLDDMARINKGLYVAPEYDLERFLVRTLITQNPAKYTVHRKITVGERVIENTTSFDDWFKERTKPPRLRNYKLSRHDGPETQAHRILDEDIASVIAELMEKRAIMKGKGYGIIKNKGDASRFTLDVTNPFPITVDERILDSYCHMSPTKSAFCAILEQQRITTIRLVGPLEHQLLGQRTREISLQQLAD